MQSRTDVALGKPLGVWFPPRNGGAAFVRLTKGQPMPTLASYEEPEGSDSAGGSDSGSGGAEDPYAAARAAAFD